MTQTLKEIFSPPAVVEFSYSSDIIIDAVSARTTALLVDQVISALKLVLYGDGYRVADGEVYLPTNVKMDQQQHHSTASVDNDPVDDDDGHGHDHDDGEEGCRQRLFVRDEAMWSAVGVSIPLTQFNPISHFSRPPFQSISLQSLESIQLLLSSLTLPLQKLRGVVGDDDDDVRDDDVRDDDVRDEDASSSSPDRRRGGSSRNKGIGGDDKRSISFSLVQYHTLLDIFGNDPLVRAVIARHAKEHVNDGDALEDGDASEQCYYYYSIDSVRSGRVLYSLNLSTPPLVAYASQLRNMMMMSRNSSSIDEPFKGDKQSSDDDNDGGAGDDDDDRYGAMDDSELGLHLITTAISNQKESKGAMIIGDSGAAIELLTDDVLEYFDDEDEDEDDEDSSRVHVERIKNLVPTHLKVALLTER